MHDLGEKRSIISRIGDFEDDRLSGNGVLLKNRDLVYEGGFYLNSFHGQGREVFQLRLPRKNFKRSTDPADLTCKIEYCGQFSEGKRHGRGELIFIGNFEVFRLYFDKMMEIKIKKRGHFKDYKKGGTFDGLGNQEEAEFFKDCTGYSDERGTGDNEIGGIEVVLVSSFVGSDAFRKIEDLRTDQSEFGSRLWIPSYRSIGNGIFNPSIFYKPPINKVYIPNNNS